MNAHSRVYSVLHWDKGDRKNGINKYHPQSIVHLLMIPDDITLSIIFIDRNLPVQKEVKQNNMTAVLLRIIKSMKNKE